MDDYTKRARRYVALADEIAEAAAALKVLTDEKDLLEQALLEDFADAERQKDDLAGRTIYLRRDTYASAVADEGGTYQKAIAALRKHGLGALVKTAPQAQSLRSWVIHEQNSAKERGERFELPDDLKPYITINHVDRIVASGRKAG